MDTKVTSNRFRLHSARQIQESLVEPSNTAYYLFVGNHDPAISGTPELSDDNKDVIFDVYQNMICGKRVSSNDIALAIRNIPYVANFPYAMYDDQDDQLHLKDYFVITTEGSFNHVYKCLDNNNGANSTIEPNFSHVSGSNSYIYQTSDGYRWKYMYSASSSQVLKFSTSDYFPVFPNTTVSGAAQAGCLDIIKVDGMGQGYDNYVTGTFSTQHIRVDGNSYVYEVSNTIASSSGNFYRGCIIYLTTGDGAGQYETISSYISNSSGKFITLESPFDTVPSNGTEYEIYPEVKIYGTGPNIVNAIGRALVNSIASNSVYRVELLNRGSGYTYVYSANVVADASVGVAFPAELRPINSPPKGHGYDAADELSCNSIIFSVKLSKTESGTIPSNNIFKQIGLIQDPTFSNVSIEFANQTGTFAVNEKVLQIIPYRVQTNATVNTTSAIINCSSGFFTNQFRPGDLVFLESSDGLDHQIATVSLVVDNTNIIISTNGYFACTETNVYKASFYTYGYVTSANGTHVLLANVQGVLSSNDLFIGELSGAKAQVDKIYRNGKEKDFNTFVQMYKYTGVLSSGGFIDNEWGRQSNSDISQNSVALIHSTGNDGTFYMYTSKQTGEFRAGGSNTITGETSGARMRIDEKFPPELVYGTGKVIFVENVEEVTRTADTTETFQIILSY